MPLEKLQSLVETLKERIAAHGTALKGSEALTRYVLIDPLLRELGWNTADPSQVVPEFKSGKGWADYALFGKDGKPAMMVEAKSLGSSLRDTALTQGIQYCLEKGTKYFALTDGSCWEIYETHRPVPIEEKRVVTFDFETQPVAEVCLQSLALWRPSLESGSALPGHVPFIKMEPVPSPTREPEPIAPEPTPPGPGEDEWQTLLAVKPASGAQPPAEIQFPDSSRRTIKYWKDITVEVTRWLVKRGHLRTGLSPIQRGKRYLISPDPRHPTGAPFKQRHQVESLYIETNYSAPNHVDNSRTIIKHVGQDPAQFKVRFD